MKGMDEYARQWAGMEPSLRQSYQETAAEIVDEEGFTDDPDKIEALGMMFGQAAGRLKGEEREVGFLLAICIIDLSNTVRQSRLH